MNVKIPGHLAEAIDEMAHKLNATKPSVMLALLNEGLAVGRAKVRK
jgi:pyrrolidone-carboxylate peptidase